MVDDEDFAQNWKKYYQPTKNWKRIVIKPTWEDYSLEKVIFAN